MTHVARIAGILAVSLAAATPSAAADLNAQAVARAAIVEPMAVRMQWATAMPSVRGGVDGAVFAGRMPSMAWGMTMPANARLTILREDTTGAPVTAPGAFEIATRGPGVVVRTDHAADARLFGADAFASGALQGHAAASIDVARSLPRATTDPQPARAGGALVVMVQYN